MDEFTRLNTIAILSDEETPSLWSLTRMKLSAAYGVKCVFCHTKTLDEKDLTAEFSVWVRGNLLPLGRMEMPRFIENSPKSHLVPDFISEYAYEKLYENCFFINQTPRNHWKDELYGNLIKSEFAKYAIPTLLCRGSDGVKKFLLFWNSLIIKPVGASKGEGVCKIEKQSDGEFLFSEGEHSRIVSADELYKLIDETAGKTPQQVQPCMNFKTRDGSPVHFRLLVARGDFGAWKTVAIYPLVGERGGVVSNRAGGGKMGHIETFPFLQYGDDGGKKVSAELSKIADTFPAYLQSCYPECSISSLGIDVGVDIKTLEPYIIEANLFPASEIHYWELIETAVQNYKHLAGAEKFDAAIPRDLYSSVGITALAPIEENLCMSLHKAKLCRAYGIDAVIFDINTYDMNDNTAMLYVWDGSCAAPCGRGRLPHIIDNFQIPPKYLTISTEAQAALEKYAVYANNFAPGGKLSFFAKLLSGEFASYAIPTTICKSSEQFFGFFKIWKSVVVKPFDSCKGIGVSKITMLGENDFAYEIGDDNVRMTKEEITEKINLLLEKKQFILQPYMNFRTKSDCPYHIRALVGRAKKGRFKTIAIYPIINSHGLISNRGGGGLVGNFEHFCKAEFGDDCKAVREKVMYIAEKFPTFYQSCFKDKTFSSFGLDIAIERGSLAPYILEANTDPGAQKNAHWEIVEARIEYYPVLMAKAKMRARARERYSCEKLSAVCGTQLSDGEYNALCERLDFAKDNFCFAMPEYFMYDFENKTDDERREFIGDLERHKIYPQINSRIASLVFNDKFSTYKMFEKYYGRECAELTAGSIDGAKDFAARHKRFVAKPLDSSLGIGVHEIECEDDIEKQLIAMLQASPRGYIFEEKIIAADEIRALNPSSVNTLRITTLALTEKVYAPFPFMKIGQGGSFVDNGGAGGILVGVDTQGRLFEYGIDECGKKYYEHPDTKIKFGGYQIPRFDEAVSLAEKLARIVPAMHLTGWDLALTKNGWIMVEGNASPQFIGQQATDCRGKRSAYMKIIEEIKNESEKPV